MIEIGDKKIFDDTLWFPHGWLHLTERLASFSETEMELEMETTTENRKRRGYVKKRVKTSRRTTEAPEVTTSLGEEERNSLEDILFNEVESFEEDKFLVALRLSPVPEQLVKGYEFQMLNK